MNTDVIIAGGGPVGLMLACELRLAGVAVTVLETRAEPDLTVKAGAVNGPTIAAFYRRGLLPALRAAQERGAQRLREFARAQSAQRAGDLPARPLGHFAGLMLSGDLLDDSDPDFGGMGPIEGIGMIPQQDIEAILAERGAELGVDLRRSTEVTGFEEDADGVTVHTAGGADLRAGWLVGCDGGRSTVRKRAGFPFPGTDAVITGHQARVEMTGAEELRQGWNHTDRGVYVHGPMPGRVLTVEYDGPPADRTSPVTAEEIQTSLRRVSGVPVVVTRVVSATRFTDNARQASTYRLGRVLLAGDAAHVHSPFGAQGLNLGIGDAVNLGWKLAAVVRGHCPADLLDTYTAERHPIGAWALNWTRAQVELMRPTPGVRALRAVFADLANSVPGTTHLVKRISGVWQRYDLPGDHELVGRRTPDLRLDDGSRLADHCHDGRALLLDLRDDPALRATTAPHGDRLHTLTATTPDRPDLAAVLIRPDGYTAWAADTTKPDLPGLTEALTRWLGPADGG